ncbi:hypothetical protein JZ751_001934 [Albula glossodonta]|uniref:Clarin 1 n=1 Tax=Albula glossodonta TaxID=121402 RepID=A0A8T2P7H6_9TELE|nr:hypothetical protein JZ751_001934 [Albula glossodonta]
MPSRQKKVIFCLAGVLSFACVLVVAAAMGTQFWVKGTVLCKTGAQVVNATGPELEKFIGKISYGLFHGQRLKQCGLGGRPFRFSCSCSCLVMILFASEVKFHRLSEKIANYNESTFVYKTYTERFDRSFWIILFTFLSHTLNILLIRLAGIQFPFQEAKEATVNTGASDLMY